MVRNRYPAGGERRMAAAPGGGHETRGGKNRQ
jgi:hypothetical protein